MSTIKSLPLYLKIQDAQINHLCAPQEIIISQNTTGIKFLDGHSVNNYQ